MNRALLGVLRRNEAWLPARVRHGGLVLGEPGPIHVVIDTGFTDWLALPRSLLRRLESEPLGFVTICLADGRPVEMGLHVICMEIHGRRRQVRAFACDGSPLIGMSLLDSLGRRLVLDFERKRASVPLRPSRARRRKGSYR